MQQDLPEAKGYEILSFEVVELTKTESGETTFIDIGTLFVLLFQDFRRFILRINNWNYALYPKLKITASSKDSTKPSTYNLPSQEGFYTIKITRIPTPSAILNFETILNHSARLNYLPSSTSVYDETTSSERSQEVFTSFTEASKLTNQSQLLGVGKVKRGIAKVADRISRVFVKVDKENLNLTKTRDFGSIKTIDHEVMAVHEFSRGEIEEVINVAKAITENSTPTSQILLETSFNVKSEESTIRVSKSGIPVPENEDEIIEEIEKHRDLQIESRRIQEVSRQRELQSVDRERELLEQARRDQQEKTIVDITRKEEIYMAEIQARQTLVEEQQQQLELERIEYETKERLLLEEIGARLVELREKEKLSQEEHAEYIKREQELLLVNQRMENYSIEILKRSQEIQEEGLRRELELIENERLTEAQREEFLRKEAELRALLEQRLASLRNQEELTEVERLELQRRENELFKMTQLKDLEKFELERKRQEAIKEIEQRLHVLREKELLTEAETLEFEEKKRELEDEITFRLAELHMREELTEDERHEVRLAEQRLEELTRVTEFERIELNLKQNKFYEESAIREATLEEMQILTAAETIELNKIRERLAKEIEIAEIERTSLELVRSKILADAQQRENELIERQMMTEVERAALELKEQEASLEIERRLTLLREKERLTEEEILEVESREAELLKITKLQELNTKKQQQKLKKIREREVQMLAQNKLLIEGQVEMKRELEDMQNDLKKPAQLIMMTEASVKHEQEITARNQKIEQTIDHVEFNSESTTSG